MSNQELILAEIQMERANQDDKWGEQNHDNPKWACIATEELGEIAKAILEGNGLREEIIQLAAVCVVWVECLDRARQKEGDKR